MSNCSVHQVNRVRLIDQWDIRLGKIQEQAKKIADAADIAKLVHLIDDVVHIRQLLIDRLKTIYTSTDSQPSSADLDRIIRLELFLKGQPDSRIEVIDPFQAIILAVQQYDAQHHHETVSDNGHPLRETSSLKLNPEDHSP